MEPTPQQAAPAPQSSGISTTTIIVGVLALLVAIGLGWMIFGPKKTVMSGSSVSGGGVDQKIPGLGTGQGQASAGASSYGFLTDPEFFQGFNSVVNNLVNAFKKNPPANSANNSSGGNGTVGPAVYPQNNTYQGPYVYPN